MGNGSTPQLAVFCFLKWHPFKLTSATEERWLEHLAVIKGIIQLVPHAQDVLHFCFLNSIFALFQLANFFWFNRDIPMRNQMTEAEKEKNGDKPLLVNQNYHFRCYLTLYHFWVILPWYGLDPISFSTDIKGKKGEAQFSFSVLPLHYLAFHPTILCTASVGFKSGPSSLLH